MWDSYVLEGVVTNTNVLIHYQLILMADRLPNKLPVPTHGFVMESLKSSLKLDLCDKNNLQIN